MRNLLNLQLAAVTLSLIGLCTISTCQFHRDTTGVVFSPYVKTDSENSENGYHSGLKGYTIEDIKTMLTVVSTKFTKIVTLSVGVGSENVQYEEGVTYKNSFPEAKSAEAAALVNREKGEKNLTMLIGIWVYDSRQQTNTEIKVALEAAQLANSIFNGTVEGLVLGQSVFSQRNLNVSQEVLLQLGVLKNSTSLKVGTLQICDGILGDHSDHDNTAGKLSLVKKEIIKASDFIICALKPMSSYPSGAFGLSEVQSDFLRFRKELREIKKDLLVMGETSWSYRGNVSWETVENLKHHWETMDKWGAANNFTLWMLEAFDVPVRVNGSHRGWWRLKDNSLISQLDGYVENVLDPPEVEKLGDDMRLSEIGVWTYVGLAIAAVVFFAILSVTGWLYSRVQKLQEALTNGDIQEFMYGLSEEAQQQEGETLVQFALTFPYDKSYEIAKNKLTIKREALLGSGEFGCVYKALIGGGGNEQIEVALKMAKKNCPKNTLLGLLSEIKTLIYLGKHPNITSIQGAYTARLSKGIVYLATELCAHGSLEGYLRKNPFHGKCDSRTTSNYDKLEEKPRSSDYTFMDMVRWSHEIGCGMEYLGLKQVIHADLATRNVLLDDNKTAKITDFGLSRRLYDYTNYVKSQSEPLPWRWLSVESLKRLEFSEKSDVWSYGVTLWEIFALGDVPYPGLSWNPEFVDFLVNGLRLQSPIHATPEMYAIMVSCWNLEPRGRPSFSELKLSTAQLLDADRKWDQENSEKLPSSG